MRCVQALCGDFRLDLYVGCICMATFAQIAMFAVLKKNTLHHDTDAWRLCLYVDFATFEVASSTLCGLVLLLGDLRLDCNMAQVCVATFALASVCVLRQSFQLHVRHCGDLRLNCNVCKVSEATVAR